MKKQPDLYPPRWMDRLLQLFCKDTHLEIIQGDLHELFYKDLKTDGLRKAQWKYFRNVLDCMRPFAFKQPKFHRSNTPDMFQNYFKIAFRNLRRNRGFSSINILGLAVGMTACILMMSFVQHELAYDQFHEKADRINRLTYSYMMDGKDGKGSQMPFPVKAVLLEEYPEVEKVTRFYSNNTSDNYPLLKYGDRSFTEEHFLFADPNLFEVFDFKLIDGQAETALEHHTNLILTQSAAKKYFGEEDPIGKTIRYQNETDLQVTAIVEDPPKNSHIQFDFLAPINLQRYKWMGGKDGTGYDFEQDWNWAGCWLFALLKEKTDPLLFENKIQSIAKKHFDEDGQASFALHLQPLTDLHFDTYPTAEMSAGGSRTQVYGLGIIALLILLIAAINFMNLSTARSVKRSKEVGVRKVLGAYRGQLIGQFLGEAIMVAMIAALAAGVMAELFLPAFNQLTGKELEIGFFENPTLIGVLIIGAITVGLVSGSYPAFFLSYFKPIKTLRGSGVTRNTGNISVRKALVVTQFVISTALMVGVFIVWQQLDYLKNKNLGYDKENVLMIKNGWAVGDNYNTLKTKLESNAAVKTVYRGYAPSQTTFTNSFNIEGKTEQSRLGVRHIGFEFFDFFNIDLLEGRFLSAEIAQDSSETVMINEAAAQQIGWTPEEAIGKQLSFVGGGDNKTKFDLTIVGVTKNANFKSLYQKPSPVVFKPAFWGGISLKLLPGDLSKTISNLEKDWKAVMPNWPLEYTFLDETLAAQYEKEEKLSAAIQFFALLAIFIACMGLLGLAAFTVEQKSKEMSIRKVLGASAGNILSLLSLDFLKLVVIALLIATPISWYLMDSWLQDFAYRIDIQWWVFIVVGVVAVLITIFTVGFHALKAALSNPVEELKVD